MIRRTLVNGSTLITADRGADSLCFVVALVVAALAAGSAQAAPDSSAGTLRTPTSVVIPNVPHVLQKPDFCGEACVAAWLNKLNLAIDQDAVFNRSGVDPLLGRGCYTKDLAAAMRNLGFQPGKIWYSVKVDDAANQLDALWNQVRDDLDAGQASIVCTRFDARPNTTEHFRLIVGYDTQSDEVVYHDPAIRNGAYLRMKRSAFLDLWPLKYRPDAWTVVWLRTRLDMYRYAKPQQGLTAADFAQHVMKLKERLPHDKFTVIIQRPFVVIGDESPDKVRYRTEHTVKWAVDSLKASFFQKEPDEILDIWLFKDKNSYEKHASALFGSRPDTPFGYFTAQHKALVMNISTGGGTLVHEIVHPFVAADFPACPSWLNEGLGSLFEQCGPVDGRIEGFTNWRLAGLQEAIQQKRLPSFKALCSTTTDEFYDDPGGTNYAQARYLCYYLQEHDLLQKFYRQFRAAAPNDPSGYNTLVAILATDDMAQFQADWQAWVLKLRFGR